MEIERKFKVKAFPDLSSAEKHDISQWYISCSPEKRVRRSNGSYVVTEKSCGELVREEKEYPVEKSEAESLISSCGRKPVEKTRYTFTVGKLKAELDIYKGELSGLAVCEFEFDSVEEAKSATLPEWLGKELTDDKSFRNASLSKKINGEA